MSGRDIRTLGDAEARLLLALASQGRQVFTTADAQAAVGGPRHRANKILARLSDKHWVLRLRRGLYLILPFEAGVEGTYSVHPFRIVPHLARPYALAYWTALHHYGYTEQIPGIIFVTTTTARGSATLTIEELGLTYRFVTLAPHKFFGHHRLWIEGQEIAITDRAKTIIDCLDHPEHCGGVVEAAKGLYESLSGGDISPPLLTEYAGRMQNRAIFKRLGYLAELLRLPVGDEVERWRAALSTGYSRLDPLAGEQGPYDSRWQLRLNRTPADLTDWLVH
ncbi:MAG: type IV toxin-antitoxin system AbiEi family antitoxin domain-containing protein [Chloroflexota bacterium]|nr:type IV toxin-antitoxin system AbiEi family antitoxin domain-containing protein [Chloroflexota bacterium]